MSISTQTQAPTKKLQAAKAAPGPKAAPKPPSTGLSREELRQIVLEMIG
jgi:hypothetical protein